MPVYNTSTADGRLRCSNATYATARDGTGTFATDTTATFIEIGQELFGGVYYCYEGFWDFDTSSIPASATITSATLEGYVASYSSSSSTAAVVRARVKDWGTSVTSADWVAGASVSSQTLVAHLPALSGLTLSAYNTFIDDALAANINKGGVTRLMLTTDRFEAGTAPTGAPNGGEYASLDSANGSNPPKLTVTYTVEAPGGNAAGTGASYAATNTVSVGALIASAVATVSTGQGSDLELAAPAIAATGAAYTAPARVQPDADAATATGAAYQPPLSAPIGNAAATGAASQPGFTVKPSAAAGAATGAASNAITTVAASAALASPIAFAAALEATVDTTTYASAEAASATGAASGASETIAPNAQAVAATGTSYGPGIVSDSATVVASGYASAQAEAVLALALIAAASGYGSGAGSAHDAAVTISVPAGLGSATVAALVARAGSFTGPSQGSGPRGRSPHHRPHVVIR